MKRLFTVLAVTLALNFLVLAGGVGWLWSEGRLDREKVAAIKGMLFPKPEEKAPATQPASTQPVDKLEEMLKQYAGLPAAEQLRQIRQSFDSQMAQLDRARRGLADLQRTVTLAQEKLATDRAEFETERKKLEDKEKQAEALAKDQGFQDTLELYQAMPAKQVKAVFMKLEDKQVVEYLQAMEGRAASKILKEFKSPEEEERLKRILELMRQAQAATTTP